VIQRVWNIDGASYRQHPLHDSQRIWPETNCYVDVWIEILNQAGHEPQAALPFVFGIDFDGDQWTLFKFPHADLARLYGVAVTELNIWRPLVDHLDTHVARGQVAIVEVDAFHLPDSAGTAYRREHVKTSIGVQLLDREARRLGYFHNASYFELCGDDFDTVLRIVAPMADPMFLPPYAELATFGTRPPLHERELVEASLDLLHVHLAAAPVTNPIRRYAAGMTADLRSLGAYGPGAFHRYAFATLRQLGASFELGASYLRWLAVGGETGLQEAIRCCDVIADGAKVVQFKAARAATTGRDFHAQDHLAGMAAAWDGAFDVLQRRFAATSAVSP
jgi:hypothetical protein